MNYELWTMNTTSQFLFTDLREISIHHKVGNVIPPVLATAAAAAAAANAKALTKESHYATRTRINIAGHLRYICIHYIHTIYKEIQQERGKDR